MTSNLKIITLAGLALSGIGVAMGIEPIAQDPAYHQFADQRELFGVPNFWNVVTNLPLVVVGLLGMQRLVRGNASGYLPQLKYVYMAFFCGVFLTGLGSSYYHLAPRNFSLLFDRLPMTLLFAAFFSLVWGEHMSPGASRRMIGPLIAFGLYAVGYWYWTEIQGRGDLRLYGLVQFLPMALMPLIMVLYRSRLTRVFYMWAVLAAYGLSKIFELLDRPIYELSTGFSGHSIKHLAAALATFMLFLALERRKIHTKGAHYRDTSNR